jgi:ankyrin repeat protein
VNVSKTQGTTSGITPFHLTAAMGHTDTARVLMTHGADLHVTDSNGFTALHFAAQNAHVDVCRLLLATNQCDLTKVMRINFIYNRNLSHLIKNAIFILACYIFTVFNQE